MTSGRGIGVAAEDRAARAAAAGARVAAPRSARAALLAGPRVAEDPGVVALVWAVRRLADALPAEESVLVRAEVDEPSSPVSAAATPAACGPARNSPRANAAAPVRAALFFLRDAAARERVDLLRAAIF